MSSELPVVACSLDAPGREARLSQWSALLGQAVSREELAGGIRYSFAPASDELERRVRELAAAEHRCCAFLEFDVVRSSDRVDLSVTTRADGQEALRFIFSA